MRWVWKQEYWDNLLYDKQNKKQKKNNNSSMVQHSQIRCLFGLVRKVKFILIPYHRYDRLCVFVCVCDCDFGEFCSIHHSCWFMEIKKMRKMNEMNFFLASFFFHSQFFSKRHKGHQWIYGLCWSSSSSFHSGWDVLCVSVCVCVAINFQHFIHVIV